jgi:dTDP-4-amino-4,6-dideoxygalactose transaminase
MNKMRVEFGDLIIDGRMRKHLDDVLDSNWVNEGKKVHQFEDEWGKLFGYQHNIAMSNGTDADIASCMALYDLGAKRGDEIIAPALAFVAVGNSILASGFTPVFVDVERETMNINPRGIEEKITPKTKAIMAVHTMGKPCDMDSITEIAEKYKLRIIEDSCEAHGAKYKGKFIGTFGDMATFSYYAAHLICCGEGGMVSTNNEEISNLVKSIKNHGRKPGDLFFDHQRLGLNLRMNDLHASIGLPQVEDFWTTFNRRRDNLAFLLKSTEDLQDFAWFNKEEDYEVTCPHAFSITLKNPNHDMRKLYSFLDTNSIMAKRNFGSMPTQHKAFEFLGNKLGEFPESEYIGSNGLHVGVHQYLSQDDLEYVSEVLHKYFKGFK